MFVVVMVFCDILNRFMFVVNCYLVVSIMLVIKRIGVFYYFGYYCCWLSRVVCSFRIVLIGLFYWYISKVGIRNKFVIFWFLVLVFRVFEIVFIVVDMFCYLFGVFIGVEYVVLRENCRFFVFSYGINFLFRSVIVVYNMDVFELYFWYFLY